MVILLYLTQKLALRRNLHVPQTLTSIHDKSSACLGLFPALVSTWKQFSLTDDEKEAAEKARERGQVYEPKHDVARVFDVIAILAYFFGLYILSITMPLLLDIGYVYDSNDRYDNITTLLPSVGNNSIA